MASAFGDAKMTTALLGKGFQSIGAEDNTPVIFSDLMDAKSLFLTQASQNVKRITINHQLTHLTN